MPKQTVANTGGAVVVRQGLSEMPLTLWVITAAIILYFYIRRARLGIDRHPAERVSAEKPGIRRPAAQPSVTIRPYALP